MKIRQFRESDTEALIALWRHCELTRPWNAPHLDIERKQSVADGGFLVAESDNEIIGSIMTGYDGHRGWVNYLAVSLSQQRTGIGRQLMQAAEKILSNKGCPKVNLQVRQSNTEVIAFYRAIGYEIDPVVSFGKRLISDSD